MLAVGTRHRVRLIDAATGIVRWDVQGGRDRTGYQYPSKPIMSPDGRFVASVSVTEENWKLWDCASGVVCMTGARHDGTGACVCTMTRSGLRTSLDEGCPVQAHTTGLCSVVFSPCGQRLATGGEDSAVILWDAKTGKAEHVMQGHFNYRYISLSFSADGARLASGSDDLSIRVWDTATGALLRTFEEAHETFVFKAQFSPADNRVLASSSFANSTMKLWDVDTGEMINSFSLGGWCSLAVFSPDGTKIATTGDYTDRDVRLVNAQSGALLLTMAGHQGQVYTANFSVDGSKLASGSEDGTCKVWDSSTGALLRTIELGTPVSIICWGRDWVLDTQRAMAFAMGHHPWLGTGSQVQGLDVELVRMILDYAQGRQ